MTGTAGISCQLSGILPTSTTREPRTIIAAHALGCWFTNMEGYL